MEKIRVKAHRLIKISFSILFILVLIANTSLYSSSFNVQYTKTSTSIFSSMNTLPPLNNQYNKNFSTYETIDGLYYLCSEDRLNRHDYGSLLRTQPNELDHIFCSWFIVFLFEEYGIYPPINRIENIYYHVWLREPHPQGSGDWYFFGYSTKSPDMDFNNESIIVQANNYVSSVESYRLLSAVHYTDPEIACLIGDRIYNFSVKIVGTWPKLRTSPSQQSFIILNLEDNETLQSLDRDNDGLTDYEELFIYYTNPFHADTDADGATDYEEVKASNHGYQNSDPNNYTNITNYQQLHADAAGPYHETMYEEIQFLGSANGGTTPYLYHWDFGDGSTSTLEHPMHTYTTEGIFTINLTVTDHYGDKVYAETTATIQEYPLKIQLQDGNRLTLSISNIGEETLHNFSWNISFLHGFFITPRQKTGIIESLSAHEQKNLTIKIFGLSLGYHQPLITIQVQVGHTQIQKTAKIVFTQIIFQEQRGAET